MSKKKNPAILLLGIVFLTLAIVYVQRMLFGGGGKEYTVESIRQERSSLVSQNLKFLSRGANFAHFEVSAVGSAGDTLYAHLRQPANYRKLKGLVWVYSSKQGMDLRKMLDQVRFAEHVEIVAYNIDSNFLHDRKGKRVESASAMGEGLAQSKRGVEMLVQFLKKHQVVDSSQVYIAGQKEAVTAVLAAAESLPGRLSGVGLIELEQGIIDIRESSSLEAALPKSWAALIPRVRVAILEPENRMSYQLAEHGMQFGQQPERISLGALPEQNEVMMLQNGIAAAVKWVVGADSAGETIPATPDSVFRKSVKISS